MEIIEDQNDMQKRLSGQMAGSRGAGYAEVLPNSEIEKFIKENKPNVEKIIIYTDGSSKGNPGPGGWATILLSIDSVFERGDYEADTTNNRMEMTAAIRSLQILEHSLAESRKSGFTDKVEVEIHTDSEYLINGITKWILGWQKNNWQTKDKREVLNKDLWEELLIETEKTKVEWKKVLGHSGHAFNERCDEIAQGLAEGKKVELYNGSKQGYKLFHQHQ